jgi:glycine/D-amino acid oxidase-like deaminating enzyme
MSPDGFPIYEQSEKFPGAFAATCHSGVTLAGAHALALAPAILAGELPEHFGPFSSRRFDVPSA